MISGRNAVLVVAGEASGDLHASKVVARLRELDPALGVFGVGGDRMREAGCELVYHCDDFAVVGLVEVLRHIPRLRSAMNHLVALASQRGTRLAVLVDYPGFNLMLAARLRRSGVRVLYYVSPQVWAWGEGRVKKIAARVDRMAVVFPFEVEFYRERGVDVDFVGHPLLEEPALADPPGVAPPAGAVLGLLPGSRKHEVERLLPPMLGAVELLRNEIDGLTVRLGRAHGISERFLAENGDPAGMGVDVLPPDAAHEVMRGSTALLISSGTATLEAACLGAPMVVVYRLAWLSYVVGRVLVKIPHIGLVNVVAGRKIVPELVQGDANAERMAREIAPLLTDPVLRERTSRDLLDVRGRLGEIGASDRVARMVLEMIGGVE
ncbi:MAG: lipid-A-disaccharide synthase [Candidatus Eisenbacteria bacterium]|nr:lipid-A-disaccharide synthase [Candidatus Eisenbacteria bacterium]